MLPKIIFSFLAIHSFVFAASVNYSVSVSCGDGGSSGSSSSVLSQITSRGCYQNGPNSYLANGIAEIDSGPTETTFAQTGVLPVGVSGSVTSISSIQDPNMSIVNTGLPNGTVLDVTVGWSGLGTEYSDVASPSATGGVSAELQLSIGNSPAVASSFQWTGCYQYQPGCNAVGNADGAAVLNVATTFQTTVGANFTSALSLENSIYSSGVASEYSSFIDHPISLSSFKVVNDATGSVINSAVLEGSSGPYQVAAVPEIDASSAASAFALIVGVLMIYRGRRPIAR